MVLGQYATFDSQSRSYEYTCASGGFQGFKTLETLYLPLLLPIKTLTLTEGKGFDG